MVTLLRKARGIALGKKSTEHGSPVTTRSRLTSFCLMLAAAVLIVLVAGCGSSKSGKTHPSSSGGSKEPHGVLASKLPASIAHAGVIQDTINSPYPPMEFSPPGSSAFEGVDIDLSKAAAALLGVKLHFTNVQFPQIIPSLTTGRAEMVWSAVLDIKPRQAEITFIDYFHTGDQLYTSAANASKYRSLTDLCGQSVVVPAGTDYAQVLASLSKQHCHGKSINVLQADGFSGQKVDIQEGRAAAGMIGVETVLYAIKQQPNAFALIGKPYDAGYYGVAFPKGKSQLVHAVLAALNMMKKNGTYDRILAKWGQEKAAVSHFTINAG